MLSTAFSLILSTTIFGLFWADTLFASAVHRDTADTGIILGNAHIKYINPVTSSHAYSSTFAFVASRGSTGDECWTVAPFQMAVNTSVCSGLLNNFAGARVTLSLVFEDTRLTACSDTTACCGSYPDLTFDASLCRTIFSDLKCLVKLREPGLSSLRVLISTLNGEVLLQSRSFTVKLLCPHPLAVVTPADSSLFLSGCDTNSVSGWSEAFVSASLLVHKSHATVFYPDAVIASYYEVFWTYRNNIDGGLSAKGFLHNDFDDSAEKLGAYVFQGCGRIEDGRYLYFKYPHELHIGHPCAFSRLFFIELSFNLSLSMSLYFLIASQNFHCCTVR
jgi:hypothetical protein